ncbi:MAG: hypothetical protein ACOY31_02620 [Bacillota bacterium]
MAIFTGYRVPERPDTMITHRMVADSNHLLWLFFQTPYRSLAFGLSADQGKTWSPGREICPDVSGPFSVFAGAAGDVYVAARREHPQDICLFHWNGREWSRRVLLKAAEKQEATCFPLVVENGNKLVHVIFASRQYSAWEWRVRHLAVDLEKPAYSEIHVPPLTGPMPNLAPPADFLKDIFYWSGDVAKTASGNIHLACRSFSGSHYKIHHYFFNIKSSDWRLSSPFSQSPHHRGHPRIITGSAGDTLHLVYQVEKETQDTLAHLHLGPDGRWNTESTISDRVEKDLPPETAASEYGPIVYWADGSGVSRRLLESSGIPQQVLGVRPASLSAATCKDRVILAYTGQEPDRQAIFLAEDTLLA